MRTIDQSEEALLAVKELNMLQSFFASSLQSTCSRLTSELKLNRVEWLRSSGTSGGGERVELNCPEVFNRGSLNFSHVHYCSDTTKSLQSATALSCIVHPLNPHAPSIHLHISYTIPKTKPGYWRIMADLNPSHINENDRAYFGKAFSGYPASTLAHALKQGDQYFFIPALVRTRGVIHFYLEEFSTGEFIKDLNDASEFTKKVIIAYNKIIYDQISLHPVIDQNAQRTQLDYHTLYFFQVLTLDRGTTAGLLVHNENDIGIMGSLPSHIDTQLLRSWKERLTYPQSALLEDLVNCFERSEIAEVTPEIKAKLSQAIRKHYQKFPEALNLQAAGFTTPPTVANHSL